MNRVLKLTFPAGRSRMFYGAMPALVVLALVAAPLAVAQTPAELQEIQADAAGVGGPVPTGSAGEGISCPAGLVPTPIYFSDFEAGSGGWTSGGFGDWELGSVVTGVFEDCDTVPEEEPTGAFSGSSVWATNLDGCYANSGSNNTLTQAFDLSALSPPIELTWWNFYNVFVSFDTAELDANGTLLFEVTTTTPTPDYVLETASLDAFAGNPSVTLTFDLSATTVVNRSGWYVDDIQILACAPQGIVGPVAPEVPTLGTYGILALVGLLLTAGVVVLLRRRG